MKTRIFAIVVGAALGAASPASANWGQWATVAEAAAVQEAIAWTSKASIDKARCKVNGVQAVGSAGVLRSGHAFGNRIKDALTQAGAPAPVANGWDAAFKEAWLAWATKTTIPGLPWYPSFAAFPAKNAPPMPNVPAPLGALVSAGAGEMTPNKLSARILAKLGSHGSSSAAKGAVQTFSNKIGARFAALVGAAQVMNVMGSGPIPSVNPPLVPAGPVVNGTCQGGKLSKTF